MPVNRLDFRDLAQLPQLEGREPSQSMWHPWIARWATGKSVLDVGSGVSTLKRDLLALGAASVTTQDPCAWCHCDVCDPIEDLRGPFDLVTCIDVTEHVVDYGSFAFHLAQLAVERVIITTPGVLVTRVYDGPQMIEREGQAARKLAASDPAVSPMGFVFGG
jgi:2-polyprenyl-3-methyl-5-hydroxy-6-metoxy-1,4-benzoquinol methylase